MKVAITSIENKEESKMDPRFGRCGFFAVYDTELKNIEFFENPNKDAQGGAGPASAQFVISKGAQMVISGDFGGKVKDLFDQLNVKMIIKEGSEQTIAQIINTLN